MRDDKAKAAPVEARVAWPLPWQIAQITKNDSSDRFERVVDVIFRNPPNLASVGDCIQINYALMRE